MEEDPIRFAGKERESSMALWVGVLEKYGLPWVEVPRGDLASKVDFVRRDLELRFMAKWRAIQAFQRS